MVGEGAGRRSWPRHFVEENFVMTGLLCSKMANLARAFYREFSFGNVSLFFLPKKKPTYFFQRKVSKKQSNKQV